MTKNCCQKPVMHDEDRAGRAIKIMAVLQDATKGMVRPAADQIVERFGRDPYLVLTSCILSLRTKDTVSLPASIRLFERAQTPRDMLMLADTDIASVIYPVCFYRRKAATIRAISEQIIEKYDGLVPCNEKDLLLLPGVGRKTANLVLSQGFGIPAICVDVHVHRISNRLGLVKTSTPEETENQLKLILPEKDWSLYNTLVVMWGQNVCVPQSPFCSRCALFDLCPRIGVTKSR